MLLLGPDMLHVSLVQSLEGPRGFLRDPLAMIHSLRGMLLCLLDTVPLAHLVSPLSRLVPLPDRAPLLLSLCRVRPPCVSLDGRVAHALIRTREAPVSDVGVEVTVLTRRLQLGVDSVAGAGHAREDLSPLHHRGVQSPPVVLVGGRYQRALAICLLFGALPGGLAAVRRTLHLRPGSRTCTRPQPLGIRLKWHGDAHAYFRHGWPVAAERPVLGRP
mmetsp:Transcript_135382/g.432904  ORF Transcript_135382/g.432904 Transcript_135382/m.432904 type:complete len:217 (+) Transcript_135382:1506-2156(+)